MGATLAGPALLAVDRGRLAGLEVALGVAEGVQQVGCGVVGAVPTTDKLQVWCAGRVGV